MAQILNKDANGFERVVLGEVLIPNVLNVYGDFHTRENIREFAYWYMSEIGNWFMDIDHDGDEIDDDHVVIVESFIARDGDPDFIAGSWVLGSWIRNDDIWQKILDGEINGYSWEALVNTFEVEVEVPEQRVAYGWTEPAILDQHRHRYFAILDADGRVVAGGTSHDDGHSHPIRSHTFTEDAAGHSHIFNLVK